jgi:hypothetical protein
VDKEYDTCIDMHYSVYRIHTDQGTYVGHTSDFNYRMGWHYNCKFSDESSRRPIIRAIRETPEDKLKVEELGLYCVESRDEIEVIERYWINKTKSSLNRLLKDTGNVMYHDDIIKFMEGAEVTRKCDESINLNMRENFDVWYVTRKMKELHM